MGTTLSVARGCIECLGDYRQRSSDVSADSGPERQSTDGDSGSVSSHRAASGSDPDGDSSGPGPLSATGGHALNPPPQDNPALWLSAGAVQQLCGEHAPVLIHCFAMRDTYGHAITNFVLSVRLGHVHRMQMMRRSALLEALQLACTGCRCVPDGRPLTVVSCALSGSGLERFSDHKVSQRSSSDQDVMHELGPARCRLAAGRWPAAGPGTDPVDSGGRLLTVEPTENPGFVLVRSAAGGGLVSAARVRRLMYAALLLDGVADTEISCSGPAAAVGPSPGDTSDGTDNVPCLRLRQWPSEEFFQRRRPQDWPPPAARDDIRRFGVHLVPVGSRHSATDADEWRLSFSRAEVVAAWHLPDLYRAALKSVKNAKNLLGDDCSGLKSYYIKTATLWLRQDQPSDRYGSVLEAALAVLDLLDAAAAAGTLRCFFWAEINLLRFLSGPELAALRRAVALLRARLVSLLTVWAANYCSPALRPLLELTDAGPTPLSERQVRTCLARGLICWGVVSSINFRADAPVQEPWCAGRVPDLLRRSAAVELDWVHRHMTANNCLQRDLLNALLVAPAEDLAGGGRLTRRPGGLLAWDAAPLTALLTAADLRRLLVEPAAVAAWCRRQLSLPPAERPAGLTAVPDTPRGLADLLLNTPLLVRALSESVPGWREAVDREDRVRQQRWGRAALRLETYSDCRTALQQLLTADLEERLRSRPAAAAAAADGAGQMAAGLAADLSAGRSAAVARLWREAINRRLADPEFQLSADRISTSLLDPWQLRQYLVTTQHQNDTGRHHVPTQCQF